jgi:hypothetical protein
MFAEPTLPPPPAEPAATSTTATTTQTASSSPQASPDGEQPSRRFSLRQLRPGTNVPPSDPDEPLRGSTSTEGVRPLRWRRRYAPGGEPEQVKDVIGGLFIAAVVAAGLVYRNSQRTLRKPTPRELDAIASPLARIACRWLPMHLLGPDLLDATAAVKATSDYVGSGPLIVSRVVAGDLGTTEQE